MDLLKNFFENLLLFQDPLRWLCWFNRRRVGVGFAGHPRKVWLALCLLMLFLPAAAQASVQGEILGVARVIDGDTIDIEGQRIRLHGIDAPESSQECLSSRRVAWRCGQHARKICPAGWWRMAGLSPSGAFRLITRPMKNVRAVRKKGFGKEALKCPGIGGRSAGPSDTLNRK